MDGADLIPALRAGLVDLDTETIGDVLHDDVVWGECRSKTDVLAMIETMATAGAQVQDSAFEAVGDRIVVHIDAQTDGVPVTVDAAVFIEDGLVIEIAQHGDADTARTAPRGGPYVSDDGPTPFHRLASVLPVADVSAAMVHYAKLGFEVESYDGGDYYGYARRGPVELHLSRVDGLDPKASNVAVYLFVDDARALYAEWRAAAVGGRLVAPEATDYGLREGAHVDPDGNLLRFGSPLT